MDGVPNRKPTPIRRSFSLINDLQSGLDPLTMPLLAVIEWPGREHITLVDSSSTRDAAVDPCELDDDASAVRGIISAVEQAQHRT